MKIWWDLSPEVLARVIAVRHPRWVPVRIKQAKRARDKKMCIVIMDANGHIETAMNRSEEVQCSSVQCVHKE